MNRLPEIAIYDGVGLLSSAFTATAATDILTVTGHGYSEDDLVWVSSDTTLPAGLSASTNYYVHVLGVNTIQLRTQKGAPTFVDVTDAGTGTHTITLKGRVQMVVGFRHVELTFNATGTANMTWKLQGSNQETMPNFNAAQSATNRWDYIEMKDLQDGSAIDGDTGIALAGADDNRILEANVNGLRWINVVITAWSAGKLGARVAAYTDD